jgi:hypothetical protein
MELQRNTIAGITMYKGLLLMDERGTALCTRASERTQHTSLASHSALPYMDWMLAALSPALNKNPRTQ